MKLKKHLLSIFVASVMALQLMPSVFATSYVIDERDGATLNLDMTVKSSDSILAFKNGPETFQTLNEADIFKANFRTTLDMSKVNSTMIKWYRWARENYPARKAKLDNMDVTGNFDIEIHYPASIKATEAAKTGTNMEGFDEPSKVIFEEAASRDFENGTSTVIPGGSVIKIHIKVKDGVKVRNIVEQTGSVITSKLPNAITLTINDSEVSGYGTHTVIGRFSGNTTVSDEVDHPSRLQVSWIGVQDPDPYKKNPKNLNDISASVVIEGVSHGGGGGGGSTVVVEPGGDIEIIDQPKEGEFDVDFILQDVDEQTQQIVEDLIDTITVIGDDEITPEQILDMEDLIIDDGFEIEYYDEDTGEVLSTEEVAEYLNDIKKQGEVNKKTLKVRVKRTAPASMLDSGEHFLYVVGYPDGLVRPEHTISREEVATIFFRLLSEDVRNAFFSKTNSFLDVDESRWSNKAISTMQATKAITGYPDGNFGPANYITRAEFATVVSKLDDAIDLNATNKFPDVVGHWAEKYIAGATKRGWLAGNSDGLFKPDDYITRAEAMSIINRMLNRSVDGEGLIDGTIPWPDNLSYKWYYYDVIEATNSHDFERGEYEKNEKWTVLTEPRDWLAIEEADFRKSLTREQKFEGWEFTAK